LLNRVETTAERAFIGGAPNPAETLVANTVFARGASFVHFPQGMCVADIATRVCKLGFLKHSLVDRVGVMTLKMQCGPVHGPADTTHSMYSVLNTSMF